MTKLIVQILRLSETFRMIGRSLLSMNVNFVEIEFEWLWRKTMFWTVLVRISPTKCTFLLGKKMFVSLDTYAKKEPTLDRFFGGVGGVR